MNKTKLFQKITIPLIGLGILLSSYAYIPAIRAALGIDAFISMHFLTMILFLIAGYMAGLAGCINWIRTIAINPINYKNNSNEHLRKPHLLGLSFLVPIPFISCLLLGWFWKKDRQYSQQLDETYRETTNFHLSLHLYLLVSFFLTPLFIGAIIFVLILATYAASTLWHILRTPKSGVISRYPINIQIALGPH